VRSPTELGITVGLPTKAKGNRVSHDRKRRRKHDSPTPGDGEDAELNQKIKEAVERGLVTGAVELILRVAEHFLLLEGRAP
jgi:hypothetical protein